MGLEHVLVAGGGSGGHVFPALAVAAELETRRWRVSWLGRVEGMERGLVESRGLPYFGLPAQAVVGRSISRRAAAVARTGLSALRARRLIRDLDIGAVLGTGGYVSAPGVLGGALAGKPIVLLEPNAVPGVANRWLSRWAAAVAVAGPESGHGLRCPSVDTGVPVRADFDIHPQPPEQSGPFRLLVLGGSQGARQLNRLLPATLARLAAGQRGWQVTHQVGRTLLEESRQAYESQPLSGLEVEIVPFLDDVAGAMGAAHLVISRAGAVTLAEICAAGRAALLLPLTLAGSHQLANAHRLAESGGAEVLEPDLATIAGMAEILGGLADDRERLAQMGTALRRLARPEAAADIAALVEKVTRKV